MKLILFLPFFLGFFVSFFSIPLWIKRAKRVGLAGKDMNKIKGEEVSEAGGVCVIMGFIFAVLSYIAIETFYFDSVENQVKILSIVSVIIIIAFIGFIDDVLGWKIGLTKSIRIVLLAFASLPLVVINVGESNLMGLNIGLLYPLLLIPIGIIGASATFNFLAGYNGLETSQGIIILSALSAITFLIGKSWLGIIGFIMIACLIAFYIFNKYPAKVFPGDVLTYSIGAMVAIMAIFGNIEKIALFFFIPYILETIFKLRGRLKKESFAKVKEDGSLEMPYEKIYGLEHLAIYILKKIKPSKKVYEKEVVFLINLFQIIVIITGFVIFRKGIFP
ncbi:MAG: glycosyl transferase family 4 [Candidatus Pacearchaeota archaeon]|nr:glycosyl transferase family 4 [Candidatus Pacearchaeota archaeon]